MGRRPYNPPVVRSAPGKPSLRSQLMVVNLGTGLKAIGGNILGEDRRFLTVVVTEIEGQLNLRCVYDEDPCRFIPLPPVE